MTERNARPRDDQSREAGQETERAATIQPIVTHRYVYRDARARRDARRALDELLAARPCCTCCCAPTEQVSDLSDVDFWAASGMTMSLQKRDWAGRQLAAAGWAP